MTDSETKREQDKIKRKQLGFKIVICILLFIAFTIYGTINRNASNEPSVTSEQSVTVQHPSDRPEAFEEPSGSVPATSAAPSETVAISTVDTSDFLDLQYDGDIAVQVDLSPDDEMLAGFSDDEITLTSFESYSKLDALGRPGTAYACLGQDLMPADGEERGSISSVTPPGWIQTQYPGVVSRSNGYLYERCHLIAWSLAGENANPLNLITGTGYFNYDGMFLVVEEPVLDYIDNTGNHVMYRVTPVYEGDNLIANGVLMEAWSVEDNGSGINLCFYIFNVQPGITIDYATGENWLSDDLMSEAYDEPDASSVQEMSVDLTVYEPSTDDLLEEQLDLLPDNVLEYLYDTGWSIELTDMDLASEYGYDSAICGLTLYDSKAIYIADRASAIRRAAIHEIGHAVAWETGHTDTTEDFKSIYEIEKYSFSDCVSIGDGHEISDPTEYFVSVFQNIYLNYDETISDIPMSVEYIESVIAYI